MFAVGGEIDLGVAVGGELEGGFSVDAGAGGLDVGEDALASAVHDHVKGAGVAVGVVDNGDFGEDGFGLPVVEETDVCLNVAA